MKKISEIIQEAITPKAMDRLLMKRRLAVQGKIRGDIGEYVLTLERMLDILGQTSTKSDDHLKQFLQQWDREKAREKAAGQIGKKKAAKKKKKTAAAPTPAEEPPGEEVGVTGVEAEPEPEEPTTKRRKPSVDIAKDMPTISRLLKHARKSTPTGGEVTGPFKKVYGPEMTGKFAKGQDWSIGSRVNVGFQKNLKVIGGNASQGWQLESDKGNRYLFVPSKTPRLGRGLYKV